MASSGMLRRVALVRTDVSKGTTLAVTSKRRTLRKNTLVFLCSVRRLLVTSSVVPSSPILVTLMKEALRLGISSQRASVASYS
jgi:hypothetical protein